MSAVQDDLQTIQTMRQGPQQVHDVAILGIRETLNTSHINTYRTERVLLKLNLNLVLNLIRELLTALSEELNAVIRGRVVRGGNHHTKVGTQVSDQEGRGRSRQHAGVIHIN